MVQSITDDKPIRDLKSDIIRFKGNDAPVRLIEHDACLQNGGFSLQKMLIYKIEGSSRVENIIDQEDTSPLSIQGDIPIQFNAT
jgi:hypothetical protein